MPYASDKQKRLMQAVAHNPAFAKQVGIPQSVGKKFEVHKAKGGEIMAGKKLFGGKESYAEELKEAKAIKSGRITPQEYAREERKEERSMKTKKKFADGGLTPGPAPMSATANPNALPPGVAQRSRELMSAALAKRMQGLNQAGPGVRMAKGGKVGNGITTAKMGSVKTAAPSRDGVATKGKTKGTMVKMSGSKPLGMKRGGKC